MWWTDESENHLTLIRFTIQNQIANTNLAPPRVCSLWTHNQYPNGTNRFRYNFISVQMFVVTLCVTLEHFSGCTHTHRWSYSTTKQGFATYSCTNLSELLLNLSLYQAGRRKTRASIDPIRRVSLINCPSGEAGRLRACCSGAADYPWSGPVSGAHRHHR